MEDNKDSSTDTQVVEEDKTQVVTEVVEQKEETNTNAQVAEDKESTESDDAKDSQDEADADEDNEFTDALKKVRNEAKNLRTRLRDAEKTIEELRKTSNDALVQERDDLARHLQDLKLEVRSDKTRSLVVEAARKANAIEPDAIADALMSKVEYDESDKPTNIEKVITDYKSTYKRLFGGALGNGNIGNRNERGSKYEGMSAIDTIAAAFKNQD
jgi:hypothetical protein